MLIRKRRRWALCESKVTPEAVFLDRRRLVSGGAAALVASVLPLAGCDSPDAQNIQPAMADPSAGLYPVRRNEKYGVARDMTPFDVSSQVNNFFEFGSSKYIADKAARLPIRPWEIRLGGLVEKERRIAIDDLLARMPLEERVYRHRCVETWAMVVPWSGFPLSALIDFARPLASARYLVMRTFFNPEIARTQKQDWYPWPYTEVLTMAEAVNELAFLVTGAYGRAMSAQFGAPLRLALPWKYGFKSIKSIVEFSFVERRPQTFWEAVDASEYGFWANINPKVPHPRWSQEVEWMLGSREIFPTRIYNGYGPEVAHLYDEEDPVYFR